MRFIFRRWTSPDVLCVLEQRWTIMKSRAFWCRCVIRQRAYGSFFCKQNLWNHRSAESFLFLSYFQLRRTDAKKAKTCLQHYLHINTLKNSLWHLRATFIANIDKITIKKPETWNVCIVPLANFGSLVSSITKSRLWRLGINLDKGLSCCAFRKRLRAADF